MTTIEWLITVLGFGTGCYLFGMAHGIKKGVNMAIDTINNKIRQCLGGAHESGQSNTIWKGMEKEET